MRTVPAILTLLVCLGAVASAQEGASSKTSIKKKPATTSTSAQGGVTGSSAKKKTSSSGNVSTSSTASKSTPKSTATSRSKTTTASKETGEKKEAQPKEKTSSSKTEGGAKNDATKDMAATGTGPKTGGKEPATPSSKKPTAIGSDEPAEEEGTDERNPTKAGKKPAAVSSITPEEIEGFDTYPPATQQLIRRSLELTTQNLRYQFGSADPKAGGMDCSGTMYRVLQDAGFKEVPRQSDEICRWVMRHSRLYRTEDTATLKDKSLSALKPGDLLFWTGTYETSNPRELPISHVMLYLGKRKKDGKPVVFGASDGRTYDGQRRNGVSVFDFVMPKRDGKAAFYGYGPIPGLAGSTGTSTTAGGQ